MAKPQESNKIWQPWLRDQSTETLEQIVVDNKSSHSEMLQIIDNQDSNFDDEKQKDLPYRSLKTGCSKKEQQMETKPSSTLCENMETDVTVRERNINEKTAYGKIPETCSSQRFYPSMFSGALSTENVYILPTIDNQKFLRTGYLIKHTRTSTGETAHQCTVCNKTFSNRGNLNVHMRIHTGEKSYQCTVCNKAFARRGTLKRHMETHSEGRRHQCPECNKTYKVRDYLMRHKKTHHVKHFRSGEHTP